MGFGPGEVVVPVTGAARCRRGQAMAFRVLECVVNVSEGRRHDVLDAMARAAGSALLDVHADPDHHRAVYTLAGPVGADDLEAAVRRLAEVAVDRVDVSAHEGVHPRLGALDVVPFVALEPGDAPAAVAAARRFAAWAGASLGVPAFLYGDADTERRDLPSVRHTAFARRVPDAGPPCPHPSAGAVAVGARPPLVAVNCDLATDDIEIARQVARAVRARDGGLPGVRALGFGLASRRRAQVSMNVTDLGATSVEAACETVRRELRARGAGIERVELVGLVPEAEWRRWSEDFRAWSGIGREQTVEAALQRAGIEPGGG